MIRIVSPHLDDAVLSLGQMIAAEDDVEIVTVLAGVPADGVLTDYDRARGHTSSRDAMGTRLIEDLRAAASVGARVGHLPFMDGQYVPRPDPADVTEALRAVWDDDDVTVFVPLGIGHPDHEFVARRALSACARRGVFVYEELPYRVLHPEQVTARLAALVSAGYDIAPLPHPIPVGARAAKETAIGCYASQFPDGADDPCLLVPERVWQIERR